jgi:hypothetical protein
MSKTKVLLVIMCAALMVFGIMTSASAYTILADALHTWNTNSGGPGNYNATDISGIVSPTVTVIELYKQNNNQTADSGPYAPYYSTAFASDNETATITYNGPTRLLGSPLYLYVKDGNHTYIHWIFDVTNWNRTDTIYVGQLWPQQGSISHVTLYGAITPVPIPAGVWLLGSALVGLVGLRRKFRK